MTFLASGQFSNEDPSQLMHIDWKVEMIYKRSLSGFLA